MKIKDETVLILADFPRVCNNFITMVTLALENHPELLNEFPNLSLTLEEAQILMKKFSDSM